MERRRAAGALLALAACILCTAAAPTASNHTALDLYEGESEGCYYNFQHYGQGDRIMTNEPCLNCTCHNRMLMCYLRVCPFTKPIGQDCTVEKRADQCCPIVTCPDVPVDLLTLTSTTSPAEYGATGVGKLDKYGCSMNGKYFPEGSKVPPTPNKPCEHCYCIRNMTTCVMQECTLHVDGCTPIYHKDVCCPVRYSCDHLEDEILMLDDKTTTVRPTPGFLLTTTTNSPVTQFTQDCVHDDQIFSDGALIKTEKACEHCYCMKGDIVCVVQECGTPMENEGKNCTSLPPREGQCCPDTYICEGDELSTENPTDLTTEPVIEDLTTLSPPRRVGVEGSGYRKEVDNIPFEELSPTESEHEGSGDSHESGPIVDENLGFTTEGKLIYSTVPSMETAEKEESGPFTSVEPSDEILITTNAYVPDDHVQTTTISQKDEEITHEEATELNKIESSTNIPAYDHKLDTSEPELQSVTEKEIDAHDDKAALTTIAPIVGDKEATTIKSYEDDIVTDKLTIPHKEYHASTTASSILEDEGITTEADREQQTISIEPIKEHSYEPGLQTASTTSAPFLEEVEGIPTATYGQHVVTDGIMDSDIYDSSTDKTEGTTPAAEVTHDDKNVESTKIPELEIHEFTQSVNLPTIEGFEKTSTPFPVDLTTSKSSEDTYEGDKFTPTSTLQPSSEDNVDVVTESFKDSQTTTQISESSDFNKLDTEPEVAHTEKYEKFTDGKPYADHTEMVTTVRAPVADYKEEVIKSNEEPTTISSESVGTEKIDGDKHVVISTNAPIYDDNALTTEITDDNELHIPGSIGVTEDYNYDISTEKTFGSNIYDTQKHTSSVASITEEVEIATTEFIKDQDFVTTAVVEQESLKPSEYGPSTSSTPFLEEIENLTTETSQGHVVTDVITEKEVIKPSKQVTSATEPSLTSGTGAEITTTEPDKGLNTIPSGTAVAEESPDTSEHEKTTETSEIQETEESYPHKETSDKEINVADVATTIAAPLPDDATLKEDRVIVTTETSSRNEDDHQGEGDISVEPEFVTEISEEISPTTESLEHKDLSPSQPSIEGSHDIQENFTSLELTTNTSKTEANIPEKEMKPEIVEEVTLPTQATTISPEVTTINLGENEIDEDNILPPGRIPGEGDCLLNGVTYRNETAVPNTDKCQSDCRCVSSIIKCSPIICSSPPEYMDNCQSMYDSPDSCCPTYVCDQFRETLPPMPHIQITTELPQQSSSTECRGDQCKIEDNTVQPAASVEGDNDKMIDTSSCGPQGCTEPSSASDLCAGGECSQTSEECSDGNCKQSPTTVSSNVVCDGENCDSSSVNTPHVKECENGVCEHHMIPETIPTVDVTCSEEGGCKGTEENIVHECVDETCRRKETLDDQTKPTSCNSPNCQAQTPHQLPTESSTLGETYDEIKTDIPDTHVTSAVSIETPIEPTIPSEKQDLTTEINDYATSVPIATTQQTIESAESDSDKEAQEEPKLPELIPIDKETVTETHTKSPKLDVESDVVSTEIPHDYVTVNQQIDTDRPEISVEKQPTFGTSKPEDDNYTETTQYVSDAEENTISATTDEEIPTKQFSTVVSDDIQSITPTVSEIEKYTTEQPKQSISEVTETQAIETHERTTLSEISGDVHDDHTQTPAYGAPESEDVTTQHAVVTEKETTTELNQIVSEYQSESPTTTVAPTGHYTTIKESDGTVTDSEIQKGYDKLYTQSQTHATESQTVSLESSTQENTETYLLDATTARIEHAATTQSFEATTEHDVKATDKVTHDTEESHTPTETDKMQEPQTDHVTDVDLQEPARTEIAQSTPDYIPTEHEVHTEQELNVNLPDTERATETQKKTEAESTPQPVVGLVETTMSTISVQKVHESSLAPHKTEEDNLPVTSGYDVESLEFITSTELDRTTGKPHEIEQEMTQTEKSETESLVTEQDDLMVPVTMPEAVSKLPEILSHKKEHSTESTIISDSETEKSIDDEGIDTNMQERPSTDRNIESVPQTEQLETSTAEIKPPVKKDETKDTETTIEQTKAPVLILHEVSTEEVYVGDLDKSTEHEVTFTVQPEAHETELFIPVKTETTTILTPVEKETASELSDIISITDKYDTHDTEMSTDKSVLEYTSPQSYKPEIQESETDYTENASSVAPDSTTKTIDVFTTESSQVLIDTSTLVAPEINEFVPEEDLNKEHEAPEIQKTTASSVEPLVTKGEEIVTELPEKYNTEDYLGTKIQDSVTQQEESITHTPEVHITTLSDESSKAPEIITEVPITERQDVSNVSDEVSATEFQAPTTEIEYPITTESPEKEVPIKPIENEPSTDAPIVISEEPTIHYVPELQASTSETPSEVTDREELALSSAAPHDTEITAVDVTESPEKIPTSPETSSIKSEESSTSLPNENISEYEDTLTLSSKPSSEASTEISSQISDTEKVEHDYKITETPESITNIEIVTPSDDSHTVPEKTATEVTETSTEPSIQIASESLNKDELTEPTSAPMYLPSETTHYLIELQEHTHKPVQESTTSSPFGQDITTEQIVSGGGESEHTGPLSTIEPIGDKQTEFQEPTKQYAENTTPFEISDKFTQPTISKEEESIPTTQSAEVEIKETTIHKDEDLTTSSPTKEVQTEKESTPETTVTENVEKTATTSEKPVQSDLTIEITTQEEIGISSTEKSTTPEDLPTQAPAAVDKVTIPEAKPADLPSPIPDLSKPGSSDIQPTDEVTSPEEEAQFSPSGSSGYGGEPDYGEEDQAFGPGTCRYGGKVYVSAQQIPRDDPCDFCFCFRSDIICLQQSCPPPIHGCHEEPIQGFCCPRYECPVSMATTLNVTTTTTTTTTTLPPHFPTHSYKGAAQRRGCQIKGHTYKVGEVVRGSSGPCLHCTCGGDGQMKCDPKACTPEPMLRQMIAAAVSAKRRR